MERSDDLRPDQAAAPGQPPKDAPLVPGYSVGAPLGAGASAVVWAATRDADGAPVAVKVVTVGHGEQADAAVRELGVLARVEVEGLVRFHEAVALPGDERRVALVLDHVGGGSLHRVVRARGHLSVGEAVTVLAPVARALAGLHAAGVVHGDVTPGNVLVERSGRPLLADLGVARLVGEAPGEVVGTEGFVAPEVLDGGPTSPAADVYAAGALAWWCVTGEVPGPASWRPSLESLAPGLPPSWSETTVRALSGDPSSRPSAAEVALAWFDSAQCEPLRLVVGTDETSLLTHRLRRPAPEVVEPEPLTPRQKLARAARIPRRSSARRRPGRGPRSRHRARSRPRAKTAAALAGVALVAVLLVGALMAGGLLGAPGWVTGGAGGRTTPVAQSSPVSPQLSSPRSSSPMSARQSSTEPSAPSQQPGALMQELASLRAGAMVSGKVSDLGVLDAPGSAALARDTADLERVRAAGLGYAAVRLTVRSARTVAATERAATVEAVVDTAAYRVVSGSDPGRVVRTEPAARGETLRFLLVWSEGRWLVERVDPVT